MSGSVDKPAASEPKLRVAVMQTAGTGCDKAANLGALAAASRAARDAGATLLVTPEMFLTGYAIGQDKISELAEPASGHALRRVFEIARENGIGIVIGYPERGDDDRIFNAAAYVDPSVGLVANYRKSHLFGDVDRDAFSAGDGALVVFTIGPFKAALLICYDIEFPENARALTLCGADILLVPTALMEPYSFIPRTLVPTRAYENQVFLIYANRCGVERDFVYYGESVVVGPDGVDLARAGADEILIVAELDPGLLSRSRTLNTYLTDRRPELYGALSKPVGTLRDSQ
jgi:predicted amidohydrolase